MHCPAKKTNPGVVFCQQYVENTTVFHMRNKHCIHAEQFQYQNRFGVLSEHDRVHSCMILGVISALC